MHLSGGRASIDSNMNMKVLTSFLLCTFLVLATGCVSTVDGRSKAGIPGKDKIVKRFDRPMQQTILAARTVLSRDGQLLVDNIAANAFEGIVKDCRVWVKLEEIEPKLTQVTVQARVGANSDVDMAADISTRIALQLSQMP